MKPLLRNALVMLTAVALAAVPLASVFGASMNSDCVTAPAASVGECCGDAPSRGTCGATCVMGGAACMAPANPGAGPRNGFDAPAALLHSPPVSGALAPDTAPPKSSFA